MDETSNIIENCLNNNSNKYIVLIDHRERDIIENIQNNFLFDTKNLDLGDIQIYDIQNNTPIIIIERKTYNDLAASLKDGRYKEQKLRTLNSTDMKIRKIMVLEGNKNDFPMDEKILNGVIINSMIRDQIHVYFTFNVIDTVLFIKNIYNHLPKYYDDLINEIINNEKIKEEYNLIKSVKKENLTKECAFQSMLNCIPQVSNNISKILVEKYKTFENMIHSLKNDSESNIEKIVNIISNIKYGSSQKRIGESISKKIVSFIFNISDEELIKMEDIDYGKDHKPKRKNKNIKNIDENKPDENNVIKNKKKNYKKNNNDIGLSTSMFSDE